MDGGRPVNTQPPIYDGHPPYRRSVPTGWLALAGMVVLGVLVVLGRVW